MGQVKELEFQTYGDLYVIKRFNTVSGELAAFGRPALKPDEPIILFTAPVAQEGEILNYERTTDLSALTV